MSDALITEGELLRASNGWSDDDVQELLKEARELKRELAAEKQRSEKLANLVRKMQCSEMGHPSGRVCTEDRNAFMSDKFTKLARGRECQVRLPGICNFDTETTVLAHYRMVGISGAGLKAHSLLGAWSCSACHDAIDRRTHMDLERDYVQLAHLKGMVRTIAKLIEEGIV